MARLERIVAVFWIGIAFAICIESLRMGPGSFSNPGAGLVPLGCGLILGLFGAIDLALTFKRTRGERIVVWKPGTQWGKMISIVVAITGYAFLLDFLGFHLITFLCMVCVNWGVGEMRWKGAVLTSFLVTFSCYLLFEYSLEIPFPKGFFGF